MEQLFSAVSEVWNVISNPVINGVTLLASAQRKADELFRQTQLLQALKDQLNLRVETLAYEDLTNKRMSMPVKIWSEQVENLIISSMNVAKQLEERQSSWNCFTCGCCWNYMLVSEAVELRRRVDECMEMGRQFTDVDMVVDAPEQVEFIPIYHDVVGQDEEMKAALQLILQDDGIGIVGVCGTCGVGKTTLLQSINDHFYKNRSDFHVVIFVTASRDAISVQRMRMDIAKRLGLLPSPTETAGKEDKQTKRILKYLECRNFLLLMDDVREVVDLKELGIPPSNLSMEDGSKKMQKVVIATRDNGVFSNLIGRSLKVIEMEKRGHEESWQLFRCYLHNEELLKGDKEVEGLLRDIADECDGFPQKLITAAKSLSPYYGGEEMNDEKLVSLRTLVIKKFMPFQEKRKASIMGFKQDKEATLEHFVGLHGSLIVEPRELYLENTGQGTVTYFEIYNRTDLHVAFKVVFERSKDHHFPCDIQPEMGMVKPKSSLKVVLTSSVGGKLEQYQWLYVLFTVPREGASTIITSNMFTENIVERLSLIVCPTVETPRPNSTSTKEDDFVGTESLVPLEPQRLDDIKSKLQCTAVELGAWGNARFPSFDHSGYDGIKSISVFHGYAIHAIQVEYVKDGQSIFTDRVGRDHGTVTKISLDYPDEYLEKIEGTAGDWLDWAPYYQSNIKDLKLQSNRKTYGPFGHYPESVWNKFSFSTSIGEKIVGFHGEVSTVEEGYITRIGVYAISNSRESTIPETRTKWGPWGHACFPPFRHSGYDGIKSIDIRHDEIIYGMQIEYVKDGRSILTDAVGGPGRHQTKIQLDYPDEYLINIQGSVGSTHNYINVIKDLKLHSNRNQYGPFGSAEGDWTKFHSSTYGEKIVGFYGEAKPEGHSDKGFLTSIGVFVESKHQRT